MGRRFALLAMLIWPLACTAAQAAPVTKTGYIAMSDGIKLRYAAGVHNLRRQDT